MHFISKHLHLWLNKSLLIFAGTSHQLHYQKLCVSPLSRFCILEPKLYTLHVLDCQHKLFINSNFFCPALTKCAKINRGIPNSVNVVTNIVSNRMCYTPRSPFTNRHRFRDIFQKECLAWCFPNPLVIGYSTNT